MDRIQEGDLPLWEWGDARTLLESNYKMDALSPFVCDHDEIWDGVLVIVCFSSACVYFLGCHANVAGLARTTPLINAAAILDWTRCAVHCGAATMRRRRVALMIAMNILRSGLGL